MAENEVIMEQKAMNILNPDNLTSQLRIDNISQQIQMCAIGFIIDILDTHFDEFGSLYMICPDVEGTVLKYQDAVNIFYEYISRRKVSEMQEAREKFGGC